MNGTKALLQTLKSRIASSGFSRLQNLRFAPRTGLVYGVYVTAFVLSVLLMKSSADYRWAGRAALAAAGASGSAIMDDAARKTPGEYREMLAALRGDAGTLLQLSATDAELVFGPSNFVRSDLPVVIWQYAAGDCVLDLYFRTKDAARPGRVAHYEMRSSNEGTGDVQEKACLGKIMDSNASGLLIGLR